MSNKNMSKLLEIDIKLAEGGLTKEEELELRMKAWKIMNGGDWDLTLFLFCIPIFMAFSLFMLL